MIFTISGIIQFRSEDGTMWNLAQPDKRMSFTTIPARLFTYLLDNADKIISRDELLNNIWDKYGLEPSNNSVNQYISLIRKSLTELECEDEIIQTIPRVGFYIAGDKVSRLVEKRAEADRLPDLQRLSPDLAARKARVKVALLGVSVAVAILLLVQPFSRILSPLDYDFPHSALHRIGTIETCPLYSLTKSPAEMSKRKEQLARELAAARMACVANAVFIFQSGEQDLVQKTGRFFMTRCMRNDDTETDFSDCKAIYDFIE